mmetsp:Transcript_70971/g.179019  ORF Transcript_70971/g.179019 Transcript_70971/m.179019 type:complete len:298 (+) Transcript_70971:75-968(+)
MSSSECLGFCSLPCELLDDLCRCLGQAHGGTAQLALLCTTCRLASACVLSPTLLSTLAADRGAPRQYCSLRNLAIYDEFCVDGANHVQFEVASLSISAASQVRLRALARWMLRCPKALVSIDVHVGPTGSAASYKQRRTDVQVSCRRAHAIGDFLAADGADMRRVKLTGWGSEFSGAAHSPITPDNVRAEVFFAVDVTHFPARPTYYNRVAPQPQAVYAAESYLPELSRPATNEQKGRTASMVQCAWSNRASVAFCSPSSDQIHKIVHEQAQCHVVEQSQHNQNCLYRRSREQWRGC